MKFKNMKIAITDEVHLKAVCDVLESMGYRKDITRGSCFVITHEYGFYSIHDHHYYFNNETTLTDLLAMRDQLFMESIR